MAVLPNSGFWRLEAREIGARVDAQFLVREVSVETPSGLSTYKVLGGDESASMPASGEPQRVTIRDEFWAKDAQDDITPIYDRLRTMAAVSSRLGRPPLVELSWSVYAVEGWLQVSTTFREGCFETPPYLPRGFTVEFTVTKARQARLAASTGVPVGETRYVTLGLGDSLEGVAQRLLGDPMLGILIRRLNTHLDANGEQPGDRIKVLERTHPKMLASTEPVAPPFVGAYKATLQAIAEERLAGHRGPGLEALEAELGL